MLNENVAVAKTGTDDLAVLDSTHNRRLATNTKRHKLVIIEPKRSFFGLDFRELYEHRGLLYLLVWRDLKVRYKQAVLGIGWVVLQPLLMTLVFTVFLGRLVRVPTLNIPYPLFAYSGLVLWVFISGAISVTGNCLVANASLITKVYFPRLLIPLSSVIARLVDLLVALIILLALMPYYHVSISPQIVLAVPLLLLLVLLSLGFGLWTSALNVKYRDVGIALPVLIQLWMFASPVVYGLNIVPERWRLLFSLNPLVGILEGFRAALFETPFDWTSILISTVITVILICYGTYAFQRRERNFADIV